MSAPTAAAGFVRNRRNLILGALAAALLLSVTQLVGGGSEDPYAGLSTPTAPQAPTTTPVDPAPSIPPSTAGPNASTTADGHGHESETALRDPFCPLLVIAGTGVAAGNCPPQIPPEPPIPAGGDQPPAASGGQPMTLVDIFAQGGHLHARTRMGPTNFTVHVNDTFGEYKVASLSDTCGEFIRGEERRSLCKGEQWTDAPSPPATSP